MTALEDRRAGWLAVKPIKFPTEYNETISTMCDSVRNGPRCWEISLVTRFGLSKARRYDTIRMPDTSPYGNVGQL